MNGIEKQIAREIAKRLIAAGHKISVDYEHGYDCEKQNRALTNIDKIIVASDAVDECWWMLDAEHRGTEAQAVNGWLYFIWGNGDDGKTCLSDYTMNLEPIIEPVNDWIDSAEVEIKLLGEPA